MSANEKARAPREDERPELATRCDESMPTYSEVLSGEPRRIAQYAPRRDGSAMQTLVQDQDLSRSFLVLRGQLQDQGAQIRQIMQMLVDRETKRDSLRTGPCQCGLRSY